MDKMVSYCGLVCTTCPAYEATRDNDDVKRKTTAALWARAYGSDIKPEDINCQGCLSTAGKIFSYCRVCEIRKCGTSRNLKNCAQCDEYACEKLTGFFAMAPQAKATLEEIRK